MKTFYCSACGEISRIENAKDVVYTPGARHATNCEHCDTRWLLGMECWEEEPGEE